MLISKAYSRLSAFSAVLKPRSDISGKLSSDLTSQVEDEVPALGHRCRKSKPPHLRMSKRDIRVPIDTIAYRQDHQSRKKPDAGLYARDTTDALPQSPHITHNQHSMRG